MFQVSSKVSCFAAVLVCTSFTGCVMHEHPIYGADWAEQVKVAGDACPVIDGDYQNAGERFSSGTYERQSVSLAHLLNGGSDDKWHQAEDRLGSTAFDPDEGKYQTIKLRLANNVLHIEALRADGSSRAFDLPTRKECRDSTLILEKGWGDSDSMLVASALARSTIALGRAEDGSLLVRDSQSGVGFVVWLPIVAGTFADWTRFPPAASATAPAPEVQLTAVTP